MAGNPSQPVRLDAFQIPRFEYTGKEQQPGQEKGDAYVDLSYDPAGCGALTCGFVMKWTFPAPWIPQSRQDYRTEAIDAIRQMWENRYTLAPSAASDKGAKQRCSGVEVKFEFQELMLPVPPPHLKTDEARIAWLAAQPDVKGAQQAMRVVIQQKALRENVFGGFQINLGPAIVKKVVAHEFGHAIGLADEYPVNDEDFARIKNFEGEAAALVKRKRRRRTTLDLMNCGDNMRPDYYRPFALWLSALTGEQWRVGARVTAVKKAR